MAPKHSDAVPDESVMNERSSLLIVRENLFGGNRGRSHHDDNDDAAAQGKSFDATEGIIGKGRQDGSATVLETVLNLSKTCMGTGCLVLPFAAKQGGLLLNVFGTILIAFWNVFTSQRLCQSLDFLTAEGGILDAATTSYNSLNSDMVVDDDIDIECDDEKKSGGSGLCNELLHESQPPRPPPPPGTSTLGKVTWYSLGYSGLAVMDSMAIALYIGVLVAYFDAVRSFLSDTPFHTNYSLLDALLLASIMASLSVVPDMGYLAKASAMGLSVLAMVFMVIAGYGCVRYDDTVSAFESIHWYPLNGLTGICSWFGCLVFGFGIVPMTFNNQDSMAEPKKYIQAATISMLSVAVSYIVVGTGLLVLYPAVTGDILHEMPNAGILPVVTRLALTVVVMVTAPLLVVPCAELTEGKFFHVSSRSPHSRDKATARHIQRKVRFGICILSATIAVAVPNFVSVLSFVGSFCVAMVGFIMPPLLHMKLLWKRKQQRQNQPRSNACNDTADIANQEAKEIWIDGVALVAGMACVAVSTTINFYELRNGPTA